MPSKYAAHEIDPETLRIRVDVDFMDQLQTLIYRARNSARAYHKIVLIHHQTQVEEPLVPGDSLVTRETIGFRDFDPEFFAKKEIQCPRDADLEWERQEGRPRPFPSIIVEPSGLVAVSKESLCDGCVYGLQRKMTGSCARLKFTPLPEVQQ